MQIIRIHPDAPLKPAVGAACNGCGVCCLAEPCPVGVVLSMKWRGACSALRWSDVEGRYRCGVVGNGQGFLTRWARRLIAAGQGCDSDAVVEN